MSEKIDIEENETDIWAATGEVASSFIPVFGGLIAGIVKTTIPNQRLDRLIKFAKQLDERLVNIEEAILVAKCSGEVFIELLEEGAIQASRALSEERIEHITSIIEDSISKDEEADIQNRHLLALLKDLNDIEIIWLSFYGGVDREFREKHDNILNHEITYSDSQEKKDKNTISISYKEHLSNMGLLVREIPATFDSITMVAESYIITDLGRLMLKRIGVESKEGI